MLFGRRLVESKETGPRSSLLDHGNPYTATRRVISEGHTWACRKSAVSVIRHGETRGDVVNELFYLLLFKQFTA